MMSQRLAGMKRRLRKLVPGKSRIGLLSNRPFTINGFLVTNVEHLGTSRVGNMSWKGMIGKEKVKIVETGNSDHARTVYEIMCMPDLKEFFPQPAFRVDKYIVLEWVEGTPLDKVFMHHADKYVEDLFWFQHTLHRSLSKLGSPYRYSYFDYLNTRYDKFAGPFCGNGARHEWPDPSSDNVPSRFFHLDITPNNVIVQGNRLKIIDNELLGYGIYYPFDFFNTYDAIKEYRCAGHYLRLISQNSGDYLDWTLDYKDSVLYHWKLRVCGAAMQSRESDAPILSNALVLDTHPILKLLETQ